MQVTFGWKFRLAALMALCCFAVLIALQLQTPARLRSGVAQVDHTRNVQAQTRTIYVTLLELETSQRGYLLTLEPPYLESYRAGQRQLDAQLGALSALTESRPEEAANLVQLRSLIVAKRAELAQSITLADTQGASAALVVVRNGQGKALMDEISTVLARMDEEEASALATYRAAQTTSLEANAWIAAMMLAMIAAMAGALYLLIRRDKAFRERTAHAEAAAREGLEQRVQERTRALEQASRALELSEARLRGIFETATVAILTADETQVIEVVNPATAKMFRCSIDNLIGSPLARFVPERFREAHRRDVRAFGDTEVSARHMGRGQEVVGLRADGEEFPMDAAISHFEVAGKRFYTVIMRDITQRRRAEQALLSSKADLETSHADLQRLIAAQDHVQENERSRIARELHDDLQQMLAAIRMDAVAIGERLAGAPNEIASLLERIDKVAASAITSTRRIVNDLRPQMLEDLGLVAALEALIRQFSEHTGIACKLEAQDEVGESLRAAPAAATCLFRVAQESLNNVAKHAQASEVRLRLTSAPDGAVVLAISDDGRGIPAGQRRSPQSFGLLGMHERVRALGGTVRIESASGAGTTVEVVLHVKDTRFDS